MFNYIDNGLFFQIFSLEKRLGITVLDDAAICFDF